MISAFILAAAICCPVAQPLVCVCRKRGISGRVARLAHLADLLADRRFNFYELPAPSTAITDPKQHARAYPNSASSLSSAEA